MKWIILCLFFGSCAAKQLDLYAPANIKKGKPRLEAYAPKRVGYREKWTLQVMVRGNPYVHSLYALRVELQGGEAQILINPNIQRYYEFNLPVLHPAYNPPEKSIIIIVTLHEVRGFGLLGQPTLRGAIDSVILVAFVKLTQEARDEERTQRVS